MKTTKRILALLTAFVLCLAPLSFTALAIDYTPEVVSYNYLNDMVCNGCGIRSFRILSTRYNNPVGYDAGACWRERTYYTIECTECGRIEERLVSYRYQRHLIEDGRCVHACGYSY